MTQHRDVDAFDKRARTYERGWRGDLHHRIADRAADIALGSAPDSLRILDIGCGTGYQLRRLAAALPRAVDLVGVDPAEHMVEVARSAVSDGRLRFEQGMAEHAPARRPEDIAQRQARGIGLSR